MSSGAAKPFTLTAPAPVAPARVEDALAELWREAAAEKKPGRVEKVTRACLWNLVVYNPKREEDFRDLAGHGYGLRSLLEQVMPSLPARIIRLEWGSPRRPPPAGREALARVAAKCVPHSSGNLQIYGEEINLTVFGTGGDSHFPSLVRALLQPNLPIGLLWLDDLPHRGWLLGQMLGLCDRLLIDSESAEQDSDLAVVAELARETPCCLVDIGWMRLTPLRHLIAGFFDGPAGEKQLRGLDRVTLRATPVGRNGALLLMGWLLGQCGFSAFRAAARGRAGAGGGGGAGHRWQATDGKRAVAAEIVVQEGEGGDDGLLELEIRAGGAEFAIHRVGPEAVMLNSPQRLEPHLPLHGYSDAELVVAGLGAQGRDPLYGRVLETVAALIAAEGKKRPPGGAHRK